MKFKLINYSGEEEFDLKTEIDTMKSSIEIQLGESFIDREEKKNEFFGKQLDSLHSFIENTYLPQLSQLKFECGVYQFDSPLNFIMLKSDFRSLLKHFHQAETVLKYSL